MKTTADALGWALDRVFADSPVPTMTFAWDGRERLTEVGNDRWTLYANTPVTLAKALLRMGCPDEEIVPGMAEAFAAATIFAAPWTITSDQITAWVRVWHRRR